MMLATMTHMGSIPACAGEPWRSVPAPPSTTVYPRVCGGTPARNRSGRAAIGLSPRVRGNRYLAGTSCITERSIPACAGEPGWQWRSAGAARVYPRVCGGTTPVRGCPLPVIGLSPRVRGNQQPAHHLAQGQRSIPACAGEPEGGAGAGRGGGSIPACAGEPTPASGGITSRTVYPRVCGGTARNGSGVD